MRFAPLHSIVTRRANAHTLRITRVVIGVLLVLNVAEETLWLHAWAALPATSRIPYPGLAWLPILPRPALTPFLSVWAIAAVCFACGVGVKLAGPIVLATLGYVITVDQLLFTNHGYLLWLCILLLTIAAWSVRPDGSIAAWPLLLLRCLVPIVYGFSAVAKLTPDFLSGAILGQNLGIHSLIPVPHLLTTGLGVRVVSLMLMATEAFLAGGFWFNSLRRTAAVLGTAMHASAYFIMPWGLLNLVEFTQIGGAMVALYPLFFSSTLKQVADARGVAPGLTLSASPGAHADVR